MTIRSLRELLAEHPVFHGFDAETLEALAGCARNHCYPAGARIFAEGDAADTIHLLRHGDVAVEIAAPGRAPMIVETLHAGDLLGWGWLVPPYRAMADARALTEVVAVGLDAACVRTKCDRTPRLGYQMFKAWLPHLTERMRAQRLQMLDLYGTDANRG